MKKGWKQRKHKRTSKNGKSFTAGSKRNAFYEFYIKGRKVIGIGYRAFISDVLYNMELPGRLVNDNINNQVYVGVYGSIDKVNSVRSYLTKNKPKVARVSSITRPQITTKPLHKIPKDLNSMHIYAAHLTLGQMSIFTDEAQKLRQTTSNGFKNLRKDTNSGFSNLNSEMHEMNGTMNSVNNKISDLVDVLKK